MAKKILHPGANIQITYLDSWDVETWLASEFEIAKYSKDFFTINRVFMKLFQDLPKDFKKKIWNDWIYVVDILLIMHYDNSFSEPKFRKNIEVVDRVYYKVKRRLIDKWVIKKADDGDWYINPIIAGRSDKMKTDLVELFKEENSEWSYLFEPKK